MSYIPTCYYGNEAKKFWETRDYNNDDVSRNVSKRQYEQELNFGDSDFYKYSKCDEFQPNPTDMGVCFTYNGLQVNDILKKSNWVNSFKAAFKTSENKKIKKSEGIERENGFIFSLDTMQSYLATMKQRHENQKDVNTFWIKVHQSGEIPWMSKISSTWEKIEAHSEEMSTVFIALQGEKVDAKVK